MEVDTDTKAEGIIQARSNAKALGLKFPEVEYLPKKRTDQQNRALHLWFAQLSEALNDAGYDMRKTIREELDIPWTSYAVKEYLWRPLQKSMLGKKSTTQLTTEEIDQVYDVINLTIGERTGISVPFPSIEFLMQN